MSSNETNKAIKNSIWVIGSKVINIVIGFAASVLITRYLGAEQKGIMADSSAIMISRFSSDYENSGKTAASGMLLMFLGGVVAFAISLMIAIGLGHSREVIIYVFICALTHIWHFFDVYEYWFYSRNNSKYYAAAQSIMHIVFLGLRIIGVPLKAPLVYFILMIILEDGAVKLSARLSYKKAKDPFVGKFQVDKDIIKDLVRLALPMILSGFASTIYLKIDQVMIGKLIGHVELGIYNVGVTLAEYWIFIPVALYNSFLPLLTGSASDENVLYKKLQKFADMMVGIAYLAVLGVMIFGRWGVTLLYGQEFSSAATVLMIYIWSGIFTCLNFVATAIYVINKDTKIVFAINITGAAINFVLNIIMINLYGSIGAAFATLLEYIIVFLGQMVILRKRYGKLYVVQLKAFFPFIRLLKNLKERS